VVQRVAGQMAIQDISPGGQVLLVRREYQNGIRGRAGNTEPERELGWLNWPGIGDLSADGRTLLFDEEGCFGGPNYVVCLRGMDGSPPVKLGDGRAAALSPDGKWALAVLYGPQQRLVLYPTGPGDSTSIAPGPIESYHAVRWMPDGKRLIFAASEHGHGRRTYVQDLAGGPPRAITDEGIAGWTLSPDGRFVAALSPDQELYVCSTAGGSAKRVAVLQPLEVPVQWSPDARSIFVASGRAPRSIQVYRVDIASGRRTPWRRFSMADSVGVTLSGLTMTPDGASYVISYSRKQEDLYLVEGLK
jgi:Tol biopolymer transport system component